MKPSTVFSLSIAFLVSVFFLSSQNAIAEESIQDKLDHIVDTVKPALVRIHVVSTAYRGGREHKYQSSGSGAIISPEGHIITNHHVAGHATRLFCTLSNKEEIEAVLIGTDPLTDIAVIKLVPEKARTFTTASFGNSDTIKVGDHVVAMGSPLAISQSVTLGIVSNTEMVLPRRMGFAKFELDGEDVGSLVRWFAHDAQIYGGNSGGPLVDLNGRIVGINEISFGLGGAIPGNLAKQIAEELIENGEVQRAWLGLTVQPLLKHWHGEKGVLVAGIIEDSPAESVGIKSGDILLRLAGHDLTVRYDEELPAYNNLVANLSVGEPISVVLLRGSEEKTFELEPVVRQRVLPKEFEFKKWGITASNISFLLAKELKRDNELGVEITSVRPGGPAGDAKPGITVGDIIMNVDGSPVNTVQDLRFVTDSLTEGAEEPVSVLTTFERKSATLITVVDVGIKELKDPGLEVRKAWLPIGTQVITRDLAKLLGDTQLKGFRVTQLYGSDEDSALKVGDLIVAVDGEKLTASASEHYEELPTLIRSYKVGSQVELAIVRDDTRMKVAVELLRSPKLHREMHKYRDELFEYTVRDTTFFDKADERWEDNQTGVLVEEVSGGGWAALGLIHTGDLIQEVDGTPIPDVAAMEAAMNEISTTKPQSVVFKVLRGIYTLYTELEPKWDSNPPKG